jgi:hypothetical protein
MKKFLLSTFTLFFMYAGSYAQNIEDEYSTISMNGATVDFAFSWKKKGPKASDSHWGGFGFMFSDLKGLKDADLNQGRSYTFLLNLVECNIPLNRHWVAASGFGFDWTRYHFSGNVSLQDIDGVAQFVTDEEGRKYKDSKALFYYLKIPLLLEYQVRAHNGKKIYINGGIEGTIKLYSKSKIEARTNEGIRKYDFGGFNMFPVNARYILGFGYSGVGLIGYYQPISLFAKNKGPELYPFGAGIILNFN